MRQKMLIAGIAGIIGFLLTGCGGGETSNDSPPPDIYGTWQLTRVRGGVGGVDTAPSYVESITFRTNNTATISHSGTSDVTGPFTSKRQQTDVQQQPLIVLTLPNGTKRAILNKTATTLQLTEFNVSDRQIFDYTR